MANTLVLSWPKTWVVGAHGITQYTSPMDPMALGNFLQVSFPPKPPGNWRNAVFGWPGASHSTSFAQTWRITYPKNPDPMEIHGNPSEHSCRINDKMDYKVGPY